MSADELIALLMTRRTIPQWLHRWREPGAELTPIEIVAFWAAQQLDTKTLREWGAALGPTLRSPLDPPEAADTPPLNMLEAALIAGISANDRAVEASRALDLLYHHVNVQALHQAARDRLYPRDEREVQQLAAYVRGEGPPPAYMLRAAPPREDTTP